jgi:flagellar hook-associated protein 3 FlgL
MSKYETQQATGKKINVPSDDPIIASRSLSFRTSLAEVEQYERNISDAESWMDITEGALKNVEKILTKMKELCVQGANGVLTQDDREKIAQELKQLRGQLTQEANTTYAGRYVFSGYRTDEKVIFDQDNKQTHAIQQDLNKSNMENIGTDSYRIRLPYNDTGVPTVTIGGTTMTITTKTTADADAHTPASGDVHFIAETGELVFHTDEVPATDSTNIRIEYSKTGFKKGDLNPKMYFKTLNSVTVGGSIGAVDGSNEMRMNSMNIEPGSMVGLQVGGVNPANIHYAKDGDTVALGPDDVRIDTDTGKLTFGTNFNPADNVTVGSYKTFEVPDDDVIEYEISTRNKMEVNTLGKDIFASDMMRDLDELILAVESGTTPDNELTDKFNNMLAKVDHYKGEILSEHSKIGAKMNRLEMTSNRLSEEKLSITKLLSENEDADLAEVVTNLKTQEMIYNASLSVASKVVRMSLVDYLR